MSDVEGAAASSAARAISNAIKPVDKSAPNANKWDEVYEVVARSFDLEENQVYLTYLNRAANAQVRMAKQMPMDRPVRLGVGVCGSNDMTSASYGNQAKRAINSRRGLNCIVYLFEHADGESTVWRPHSCYFRPGSTEAQRVAEIWPATQMNQVHASAAARPDDWAPGRSDFSELVIRQLVLNSNAVLEGVPGTGKSFAIEGIADKWQSVTGRKLADPEVLVLHPSSSYEDLVEGLRPEAAVQAQSIDFVYYPRASSDSRGFLPARGRFVQAAARAEADPGRDHLLVLDELNRANVPKVFGELLLVMESSKRARHDGTAWRPPIDGTVQLTYTGARFWLPDNLFILGTMNTTDRSVAPLDAALRRRFVFLRLEPMSAEEVFAAIAELDSEPAWTAFETVVSVWADLNTDVLGPVVGPDAQLGHSYLFGLHSSLSEISDGVEVRTIVSEFLRFTLLPQLIEVVTSNGREADIFGDGVTRLGSTAQEALLCFHTFLRAVGIRLAVEGEGLARRVRILSTAPEDETPPVEDEPTEQEGLIDPTLEG